MNARSDDAARSLNHKECCGFGSHSEVPAHPSRDDRDDPAGTKLPGVRIALLPSMPVLAKRFSRHRGTACRQIPGAVQKWQLLYQEPSEGPKKNLRPPIANGCPQGPKLAADSTECQRVGYMLCREVDEEVRRTARVRLSSGMGGRLYHRIGVPSRSRVAGSRCRCKRRLEHRTPSLGGRVMAVWIDVASAPLTSVGAME